MRPVQTGGSRRPGFIRAQKSSPATRAGLPEIFRGKTRAALDVWLGLANADDALALLPLAALFENGDAFETLQDITFDDDAFGTLEAVMLGHGGKLAGRLGRVKS